MTLLAFRNLFQNKTRLIVSTGGVALALLLILVLDAIFTGVERQITAYIDNSRADIFISQSGVRNLHMASSSIPAALEAQVEAIEGVQDALPILYLTNMVISGDERSLAYIIGIPAEAGMGTAWKISAGQVTPGRGEVIIDRSVAEKSGLVLGNEVEILGKSFKISGLSEGTASITNSVAFINLDDFMVQRAGRETVSFLLVRVKAGESPEKIAEWIAGRIDSVTVQTREEFAGQERQVVKDMSTDIIAIMNLAGFLIGLSVLSLTVYTAILARKSEYGVLKALGARHRHLYRLVIAQALLSVLMGLGLALLFTLLLSTLLPALGANLRLEISSASLIKISGLALFLAAVSAILPIRQIAGLDPAVVFKGK